MTPRRHRKIVVEDSAIERVAHADLYQFGLVRQPATRLLVYFGGAIPSSVYDARRDSEPTTIVDLFEEALSGAEIPSVDLLVVPCPPLARVTPGYRSRIFTHVVEELLPRTPNPEPEAVAFLGNSAGSHIAAMLTFELEQVRSLATLGAVGLVEAVGESGRGLFAGKRYLSFANLDDPCSPYTHAFWEAMIGRGIAVDVVERTGGHAFEDYAANGSVRDAFARLIDDLSW